MRDVKYVLKGVVGLQKMHLNLKVRLLKLMGKTIKSIINLKAFGTVM
jgi:hypothetical protein